MTDVQAQAPEAEDSEAIKLARHVLQRDRNMNFKGEAYRLAEALLNVLSVLSAAPVVPPPPNEHNDSPEHRVWVERPDNYCSWCAPVVTPVDPNLPVMTTAGTELEGAQGKPATADPRLSATSDGLSPVKRCLDCGTIEVPGPGFCPKCCGPMQWNRPIPAAVVPPVGGPKQIDEFLGR